MEKAVLAELGDKKPEEITDLHLQGVNSSDIEGITEEFSQLTELELLNCGIKSLSGLPRLPSLKTLLLNDNKLKGKEVIEQIVSSCSQLETLGFVGNKFESIDDIKPLEELKHLTSLDLFNCPLTEQDGYRDKLWGLLPKLNILDGCDRSGKEVGDGEEEEEEEEEEEDSTEEDGEDDIGLDYLQRELTSDDDEEEDDYNPEAAASPPSDDHEIEEDDDEQTAGGGEGGQSTSKNDGYVEDLGPSTKKPRLEEDPPLEEQED